MYGRNGEGNSEIGVVKWRGTESKEETLFSSHCHDSSLILSRVLREPRTSFTLESTKIEQEKEVV